MSHDGIDVSRRDIVQTVGAGAAASALSGVASAGPTEYNVGIDPSAQGTAGTVKGKADSVKKTIDLGGVRKIVTGQFSAEAVEALQNNPNVDYVSENGQMEKLAETLTWGVDRIDADVNISNGADGSGATVAIIDTGLDDDHPDLQANVVGGKAFETQCGAESGGCRFGGEGYNDNACNFAWSDDDDHGSHVGGTAAAVDNTEGVIGVAPGADLLAGKALTGCGGGSFSAIADAIRWATDQGADVINMSLGASSGDQTVKDACQYAFDNDVVNVAAAGNSGPCTDCVSFPAAYSTVVAVSSITRSDTLSDFSSQGPEIEVGAPGGANDGNDSTSVLSTIPPESDSDGEGYAYFVGTSMASPHAAGVAAQIVAETDLSDNQKIIDRLKSTAEDIGLASNEQGAGLVDAEAAIGSVDAAPSASWVTPASGETVSGTVTVRISAGDSEDADDTLDVTYDVAGGSSRTTSYNSTSGYYEDSLDTTQFSDGDVTFEANATDSAGNTTTTSVTATIDNVNDAPTVDGLSASEVETSDGDAEFGVDWAVSDSDGDLDTVVIEVVDSDTGSVVDSTTNTVSGSSASGFDEFKIRGRNETYDVTTTVTDTDGASNSATRTVSE